MLEAKLGRQSLRNWEHLCQYSQLTFTCSKSTIETLEKGVKYVNVNNKDLVF